MKDESKIKYVIYCRRSSDETSEKQVQSIPKQIQECMSYAEKEWLDIKMKPKDFSDFESEMEIIKENNEPNLNNRKVFQDTRKYFIIKESHSAKTPETRPKRKKMIEYIKKWKIKWVISYSPDRQARNMIDGWTIIELASQDKVQLRYCNFHFTNNASWRMMLWFRFVFSKQYAEALSENIAWWNKIAVTQWRSTWNYKYWYYWWEDMYYKPHKTYFPLMRRAFEMKIYEQKTDKEIANWLNKNWFKREYKNETRKVNPKNLWTVWGDKFYYGLYESWENQIDLVDTGVNPYFKPIIEEREFDKLLEIRLNKRWSRSSKKESSESKEIRPYSSWKVITQDWYDLSPSFPNMYRHKANLEKLKEKQPDAELKDVILPHQIHCKCSSPYSKYQWVKTTYNVIRDGAIELFSTVKVTENDYDDYLFYVRNELDKELKEINLKKKRIRFEISKMESIQERYISENMWIKVKWTEKEIEVYDKQVNYYNAQINELNKDLDEIQIDRRNTFKEFEIFLKILQKLQQYFIKADYVQSKRIIDLFISNIVVIDQNTVKFNVREEFQNIFDPKFQSGGDDRTRTGVWKS